ncbi:uncharacterized protein LOC128668758 [Microplitis demolitor]|uniref:uncharacterized protein LOC128667358 n=1 Tax=Microplitis demolitor TaxID=69319 RepID=UPI00235B6B3C|nr:uncharacterized protein LOC128667358 [Microplitis demolitor]XP_053593086.1 uncharacterized protein LOC128667378 [Microplitis demolitor]XP_053593087.1 uncharacterized protein LOC128667378 [Microplitis demolitor]XP_053595505.1 uncharacterized protein LOC128667827 [Microplitis demolitor]XP_053598334.1 uncharacterized protein LOC128668758 [Microplitis demolitor]
MADPERRNLLNVANQNLSTSSSTADAASTSNQLSSTASYVENDTHEAYFLRNTLIQWNLQEYVDIFEREKITKDVLLQMPDDHIKELIPLYGDRHRFILNRKQLLKELEPRAPVEIAYVPGNQLKSLLKSSVQGKCILDQSHLTENADELAKIIGDHIISQNKGIYGTKEQYLIWRKEIQAIWPDENVTDWYQLGHKRKAPSGKLYNRITNTASKYRSTFKKLKVKEASEKKQKLVESSQVFIRQLANVSLDDKKTILYLWEKTHEYRRDNIDTIFLYFENYMQLRTPFAKELLELDFKLLDIADPKALLNRWPILHKQILQIAKSKKVCTNFFITTDQVPREVLAWQVLPYLLKPVSMKVGVKKAWRPSNAEQANGFITWINTIDQLDNAIKTQETLCVKYKITRQPFVIAVGPLENIVAAYTIINDEKIKCDSVTSAVDFCLKASFALNTQYTTSSAQVWSFIEKEIFIIQSKKRESNENSEINYQSVSKLQKVLRNLASNEVLEPEDNSDVNED